MGLSLAAFDDGFELSGTVNMGDIDPVFLSANITTINNSARVSNNGKNIKINVEDARPEDVLDIEYRIINKGTIPIEFQLFSANQHDYLSISNSFPTQKLEKDSYVDGVLTIEILEGIEESTVYDLGEMNIELSFKQWNMID